MTSTKWAVTRLLVGLSLLCCSSGEFVQTLVGERLTLVTQERCLTSTKGSLVHLSPPGSSRDVAQLVGGRWSPKSGYEARFSPGGAVEFESAAFNDNGVYELMCSTIPKTVIIQVEVLVPHELWVSVGQTQWLPCHFHTTDAAVVSVRWDRGTELVIHQQLKSRETLYGDRFKDKAGLSVDVQSRGDLSLRLQSIGPQDQGEYYCKAQVEGRDWANGQPPVIQLWVSLSLNCSSEHNNVSYLAWVWAGIIALVILLCISFSILVTMHLKSNKTPRGTPPFNRNETRMKSIPSTHSSEDLSQLALTQLTSPDSRLT